VSAGHYYIWKSVRRTLWTRGHN